MTNPSPNATERCIPTTMATQHPDNASPPFWKDDAEPRISAHEEVDECLVCYRDLGCQEYMWDWEGKYVDEAVVDRLLSDYLEFFRANQLGRDVFLTFRLPNIWVEKGYRIARAYMSILTAEELAHDLGLATPPLFEVILPMTDAAWKLIHIQKTFQRLAKLEREIFNNQRDFHQLQVIPLIETVDLLMDARKLLEDYARLHENTFGCRPPYIRAFIARSDPALNAGLVPAVLAAKGALSEFAHFEEETGIPVYPIIGTGSLPFRGGLTPHTVEDYLKEYKGIYTPTIQSAFRYDYPLQDVKKAIRELNLALRFRCGPKPRFDEEEKGQVRRLIELFSRHYRETVESLAEFVNELSKFVPRRRERALHIGLFGYPRMLGAKRLPRAIPFTAVFYSLGVPPEFLGTGRGLRDAEAEGLLDTLRRHYRNLELDLVRAGYFLNKENLEFLAQDSPSWTAVKEDVDLVERYLGRELGPRETDHFVHRNLASSIYFLWRGGRDPSAKVEEAALLRRSLG